MNKQNLALLAQYLFLLPKHYEHFEMGTFNNDPEFNAKHDVQSKVGKVHKSKTNTCGSTACAVGHLPYVKGIELPHMSGKYQPCTWKGLSSLVFGIHGDIWDYLFSGNWSMVDNTPLGAAQRIALVLHDTENAVEDWFTDIEVEGVDECDKGQIEDIMKLFPYGHFTIEDLAAYLPKGEN